MSKRDYYLCDCCNEKCFYDADIPDRFEQAGEIKAICKQCAETHTISIDGKAVAANIDRLKNQQALAEKDNVIIALKERIAYYDRWLSNGVYYTNDEFLERVLKPRQQLMEKAVRFAENITRNGRWQEHEWKDANIFLNSPEVRAWKERKT